MLQIIDALKKMSMCQTEHSKDCAILHPISFGLELIESMSSYIVSSFL